MGNWKLVQSHQHIWLYDLGADEGEKNDLSKSNPDLVKKLQKELDAWQAEMSLPLWPSKPQRQKIPVDDGVYELNI